MKTKALWILFAVFLVAASHSSASQQDNQVQTKMALCDAGIVNFCFDAAVALSEQEDPEEPVQTLKYSRLACDGGRQDACRYEAITAHLAGNAINQRIVKTLINGDPKGKWKYKSDLNAAIDRAIAYYQRAQKRDQSLSDDWPALYASLEKHRQN